MRAKLNEIDNDFGGSVEDAILSLRAEGVCPEEHWKYQAWGSRVTEKPSDPAYKYALEHTVTNDTPLEVDKNSGIGSYDFDLDKLRRCLDDGYPFVFACNAFRKAAFFRDGTLEAPEEEETYSSQWMGHALMGVGYDDKARCFIIQNSWGHTWNDDGCFMMPYDIIAHPAVARDFWTIREVKKEE